MIKVGTCGFSKRHFKYFEVLEVQQTFYDVVEDSTIERWYKDSKENSVELTMKALQVITHDYNKVTYSRMKKHFGNPENYGHFKSTKEVQHALDETLREAKLLEARIIVFQTPSSFRPTQSNIENLISFFNSLPRNFIYAWEPRGEEWYRDREIISTIFSKINAIHVVDPFKRESVSKSIKYYRLHGIGRGEVNYRYKYTDENLNVLYEKIKNEKEVYVMFNNVFSFNDALRFKEIIKNRLSLSK